MAKKSIWNRLGSDHAVSVCETAVAQTPGLPKRSWAYHLLPINVGTPTCESLTSYYLRLTEAHCITPRQMFEKGLNCISSKAGTKETICGLLPPNSSYGTWHINGNGIVSEKWVTALETITRRDDLRFLTFLPFRHGMSKKHISRRERAWCSACFGRDERAENLNHEQLLWTHRLVTVCPIHQIRLRTKCTECGRSSPPLKGTMRPARCAVCHTWLGLASNDSYGDQTASEYEIFIANELGRLIATSPIVDGALTLERTKKRIVNFIETTFDGNIRAFIRHFGLSRSSEGELLHSRNRRFVSMKLLTKVAFVAGTTVLDLMTKEDALANFLNTFSCKPTRSRSSVSRKKQQVIMSLEAAVTESPPPSLSEVAVRLGYTSATQLRRYSAEVCDRINRNYLESSRARKAVGWKRNRLRSNSEIESALRAALKQQPVPSLNQVARSLGYKTGWTIYIRLPDLCEELRQRQRRRRVKRKEAIEHLTKSLSAELPEDLTTLARRLRYETTDYLIRAFPKLCRRIRLRHKAHKKAQLLLETQAKLEAILSETPPPTLKAVTRRLGFSDGWLREYFPDMKRSIVERYSKYLRDQSVLKKERERERIRRIVLDLHEQGTFPSTIAVCDVAGYSCLDRAELWATIKLVREELRSGKGDTLPFVF